jgi:hypothetical protein
VLNDRVYPRNGVPNTGGEGAGGGSFSIGLNPVSLSGFREGDGVVLIEKLP